MPRLVHPQHAVHALHRACWHALYGGARRRLAIPLARLGWRSFWHISGCTKVGHMPGTSEFGRRDEFPRPLPHSHHRCTKASRSSWGIGISRADAACIRSKNVKLAGVRKWLTTLTQARPASTGRAGAIWASAQARSLSWPSGREHRQRQCGMLPSRLDRLVASEALDHLDPRGTKRLSGGRPGVDPRSSGSSELILGLIKGLPVPLHGVPVDGQGLPGLMLGVEDVQGRSQGDLALLTP